MPLYSATIDFCLSPPYFGSMSAIEITAAAAKRIIELATAEQAVGLRISVLGGGCSGFQYEFALPRTTAADDTTFEAHGAKVLVDGVSLGFLSGGRLDYFDGLEGSGFKFDNPNATASCGCGTSFSI